MSSIGDMYGDKGRRPQREQQQQQDRYGRDEEEDLWQRRHSSDEHGQWRTGRPGHGSTGYEGAGGGGMGGMGGMEGGMGEDRPAQAYPQPGGYGETTRTQGMRTQRRTEDEPGYETRRRSSPEMDESGEQRESQYLRDPQKGQQTGQQTGQQQPKTQQDTKSSGGGIFNEMSSKVKEATRRFSGSK